MSDPRDQPYLHDLVTVLRAPLVALGGRDGQLRANGVQGVYAYDRRLLSTLLVTVDGQEPECLSSHLESSGRLRTAAVIRGAGDRQPDPTVLLHRGRDVEAHGVVESLRFSSRAQQSVCLQVSVEVAADLADLDRVKQGGSLPPVTPTVDDGGVRWERDHVVSHLLASPSPDEVRISTEAVGLRWRLDLEPGGSADLRLVVTGTDAGTPLPFRAADRVPWSTVTVRAQDHRVAPLVERGLADLEALLMQDGEDLFTAAGSPWFFTLFGRDALWTARLLLPFGTDLAMGTLRALARRQGHHDVAMTEEQPGKILHEVRRDGLAVGELSLPPVYYGTVDATALWLLLLVESWRWGAEGGQVRALLPAAEAALGWLQRQVDDDPTGFVRYLDHTGSGLANQGWKDSGDSIQWADGRLADAPIALCEVQAYAYEAATGGADLLDAFGRPGGAQLRTWAQQLRTRFRNAFWVADDQGRYPAVALDAAGRAVDGIASNMGHLLGTGLLDEPESATVAARLAGPDLDSGYGLRTLTSRSPRFSPLSYHGGAVWPHDTAIAARGLLLDGHDEVAASLLAGLLRSAAAFDDRLPELYGGVQADSGPTLPYPASCRPQAWSAAAGTCVATLALGLRADVPNGLLTVTPPRSGLFGSLSVQGLQLGGQPLQVDRWPDGSATATTTCPGVQVRVLAGNRV